MKHMHIWLLTVMLLGGCAKQPIKTEHKTAVSDGKVTINTTRVWPLKMHGQYLQQLTVSTHGQQHVFNVHLTLAPNQMRAIAYNDIVGRIYSLELSPNSTVWEKSFGVPDFVQPDNIILDFLLAHLPDAELKKCLNGAEVLQIAGLRTIKLGSDTMREITLDTKIGDSWQKIVITNKQLDYVLEISTVQIE